jgi:hypothetical protein
VGKDQTYCLCFLPNIYDVTKTAVTKAATPASMLMSFNLDFEACLAGGRVDVADRPLASVLAGGAEGRDSHKRPTTLVPKGPRPAYLVAPGGGGRSPERPVTGITCGTGAQLTTEVTMMIRAIVWRRCIFMEGV